MNSLHTCLWRQSVGELYLSRNRLNPPDPIRINLKRRLCLLTYFLLISVFETSQKKVGGWP